MAENEDGQEKTEEPTARKLEQARERGELPRSPDVARGRIFDRGTQGHGGSEPDFRSGNDRRHPSFTQLVRFNVA